MSLLNAISAIKTFLRLTDTPGSYAGQGGKVLRINGAEDAVEPGNEDHAHSNKAELDLVTDGNHDVSVVSPAHVGLGSVTNDAQLKRAAGDINSFSEKASPVDADLVLIEDSEDSYNKKKAQLSTLPGGGGSGVSDGSNDGELLEWDQTTTHTWVPRLFTGSSWPAVVYPGKKYTRDDIGDGTDYFLKSISPDLWVPERSRGTAIKYVDKANGTDDKDHGFAPGSGAFETILKAIEQTPNLLGGNATIVINNETTYAENIVLRGKYVTGPYTLTLQGTYKAPLTDKTNADFFSASTIGKTGSGWGIDAFLGFIVYIYGGTGAGQYRLIESNTAEIITLIRPWTTTPDATSDFRVLDWGTTLNNNGATQTFLIDTGQKGIILNDLKISGSGGAVGLWQQDNSVIKQVNRCYFISGTTSGYQVTSSIALSIEDSFFAPGGAHTASLNNGVGTFRRCWLRGGTNQNAIRANALSKGFIQGRVDNATGTASGILVESNAFVFMTGLTVRDNATGVKALGGGQVQGSATYINNTTDEDADAPSFGYIA